MLSHVLPAVDAVLSIGTFSSLSCVSLALCGSVVAVVELAVVELAVVPLLYLTLYLFLSFYLH